MVQKYLECAVDRCQVQYKWSLCREKNLAKIYMFKDHSHPVEDVYDNTVGLPQAVKNVIDNLLQEHPKLFPKQIRIYLNNNAERLGIEGLYFELHQIQGYVNRLRQKSIENDKILNVELFCGDNMYFPTIDPNRPFFFGFKLDSTGKPIIGSGAENDPTYIFATTIKLLTMNLDTSNQNHVSLFHVDGTYKITRSRHPILVFGRSNLNKKIYPVILGIVSKEETIDFNVFFSAIIWLCQTFNINFRLTYLMQDAQAACSAAARQV